MVELPLGSVMGPAAGAIVAGPRPGSNNTVAFTLSAATPLSGDGMASQMLNTTVTTPTAVLPRTSAQLPSMDLHVLTQSGKLSLTGKSQDKAILLNAKPSP